MQSHTLPTVPADVSVVICAYSDERREDLHGAVSSVLAQTRPVRELVIVIDGNPRLYRFAQARWGDHKTVVVTLNRWSPGLSGARNTGAELAQGAVVAFLDDDAQAAPDWAERLLAAYADERVVATGGAALPAFEVAAPAWWPSEFHWVVGCSYRGQPERTSDVRNVIGCNMSVRRAAWRAVGGFSEAFGRVGDTGRAGGGDEETDLCIRLRQQRPESRIVYEPEALVHHKVPAQRLRWTYFFRRCWSEGVSKAFLAQQLGRKQALASERSYARTLTWGVLRGFWRTLRGEPDGLRVAAAIAAGFCVTAGGYLVGTGRARSQRQ